LTEHSEERDHDKQKRSGHSKTAYELYEQGAALFQSKKSAQAIDLFRRALELDPRCRDAHFGLAKVMEAEGHLKEAEDEYLKVVASDPNDGEAWLWICILRLKLRRETDAERAGKKYMALEQTRETNWSKLRSNLREEYVLKSVITAGTTPARPSLERQTPAEPKLESLQSGSTRTASTITQTSTTSVASRTQDVHSSPQAPDESPSARTHSQVMRMSTPVSGGRQSVNDIDSWFDYAYLYINQGQYREAIRALDNIRGMDPDNKKAMRLIGEMYYRVEDYKRAVQVLSTSLGDNPEDSEGWYFLGHAQMKVGDDRGAVYSLTKSIELSPDNVTALGDLGTMLVKIGDYLRASKVLIRALKYQPNNSHLLISYAITLQKLGSTPQAMSVLKKVTSIEPGNPKAWHLLADLLTSQKRFAEANQARLKAEAIERRMQ
jgi:tetratricopeptide (TPR) repeat protein